MEFFGKIRASSAKRAQSLIGFDGIYSPKHQHMPLGRKRIVNVFNLSYFWLFVHNSNGILKPQHEVQITCGYGEEAADRKIQVQPACERGCGYSL